MRLESGDVVDGRFRVERELGAGGMGVVYLARQVNVDRRVAIKLLRPERADDERAIDQFLRETAAVSRLTSPHTVTLHDAGRTDDGDPYIAMEYLPGPTLRQHMGKPIEVDEVVRILDGIALSLAEAHERGIVHRDLKPANVLLARTPGHRAQVKVLDFGLARLADADDAETKAAGTLRYMAPEALRGAAVDARADVYALAMVAYEMLTGRHPFETSDREALIDAVLHQIPAALDEVMDQPLPSRASKLIARGLAKHPRLRPKDAATFRRLLRRAFDLPDEPLEESTQAEDGVGAETHPSQTVVSKTLPGTVAGETTLFIPLESPRRMGIALGALALLAGITAFVLRGPEAAPTPPALNSPATAAPTPLAETVALRVESLPPGAEVELDGELRGKTPLTLDVARGQARQISVAAEGYETHEQRIDARRSVDLVIRLTPRPMKTSTSARTPEALPPSARSRTSPATPRPASKPTASASPAPTAGPPSVPSPAPKGNDFEQRVNDYMD